MFDLSVNVGHEDSIEVVLKPFEAQFNSPEQSTMPYDEENGLLQSSVNIRQTRRSSFHFDEVDSKDDFKTNCSAKMSNLENAKNEIAAIDRKIQSLLKKYKKPKCETSSLKSASTTPTLESDSISSITSSFSEDEYLCTTPKPLGALSLKSLEIK